MCVCASLLPVQKQNCSVSGQVSFRSVHFCLFLSTSILKLGMTYSYKGFSVTKSVNLPILTRGTTKGPVSVIYSLRAHNYSIDLVKTNKRDMWSTLGTRRAFGRTEIQNVLGNIPKKMFSSNKTKANSEKQARGSQIQLKDQPRLRLQPFPQSHSSKTAWTLTARLPPEDKSTTGERCPIKPPHVSFLCKETRTTIIINVNNKHGHCEHSQPSTSALAAAMYPRKWPGGRFTAPHLPRMRLLLF